MNFISLKVKTFLPKKLTWTIAQTGSGEEATRQRLAQLLWVLQERGAVREQLIAVLIGEQVGQMNVSDVLL